MNGFGFQLTDNQNTTATSDDVEIYFVIANQKASDFALTIDDFVLMTESQFLDRIGTIEDTYTEALHNNVPDIV